MTKAQAAKIIRMQVAGMAHSLEIVLAFDEDFSEKDLDRLEEAKEKLVDFLLNGEPNFSSSDGILDYVLGEYVDVSDVPKAQIPILPI